MCVYTYRYIYTHTYIECTYVYLLLYLPIYINNHEFIPIPLIVVQCHGLFPLVFLFPCKEACLPLTEYICLFAQFPCTSQILWVQMAKFFLQDMPTLLSPAAVSSPREWGKRWKRRGVGKGLPREIWLNYPIGLRELKKGTIQNFKLKNSKSIF